MKKIIMLALACVMMLGAQAQIVSSRSVAVKTEKKASTTTNYLRLGVGFMNVTGDYIKETSSKTGYNFVYGFQKPITDFDLYWDMNFGLGSRGYKYSEYDYDESFIAHNIQLSPVNIGWKPSITSNIKIDVHAGAYVSFDYAGKGKWEYSDGESGSQSLSDLNDELKEDGDSYKRFDVGINIGVGVWYDRFNLDLTYQTGFIDAIDCAHGYGIKSHAVLLRLGVAF
jgi:hypothetical protein